MPSPFCKSLLLSYIDRYQSLGHPRQAPAFTGLQSYQRLLDDPLVWQAFRVTFHYAGMTLLLTFVIPIFVAILLMEMPPHWLRVMMLLWFLPLSGVASTLFWRYVWLMVLGIL